MALIYASFFKKNLIRQILKRQETYAMTQPCQWKYVWAVQIPIFVGGV